MVKSLILTDNELIEQVLGGRQASYAELVRRHHGKVFGLCVSMLNDRSAAEDAAQEVFLKAYGKLKDFKRDAAFSTWLYRVASNHCLDLLRRQSRRKTESWDALVEKEGSSLQRLLTDHGDKTHALDDADLVGKVLEQLPPDYRLILVLREMEGQDYKEIMETMDCSMDSVKARLRRARVMFRDLCRHILPKENV